MSPPMEYAQLWPTLRWIALLVMGSGYYYVLWLLAVSYCLMRRGEHPDMRTLAWPLCILFLLLACPPVVWILLTKVFSPPYYPRFVWVLMVEFILACVGADLVRRQTTMIRKGLALCTILCVIAASGNFLFAGTIQFQRFQGVFFRSSNRFKLLNETIAITEYVKQRHSGDRGYFTEIVNIEVRQYDANILLVSGRHTGWRLEQALDESQWMLATQKCLQSFGQVGYLVIFHTPDHEEKLQQLGWHAEQRIGLFDVYTKKSVSP